MTHCTQLTFIYFNESFIVNSPTDFILTFLRIIKFNFAKIKDKELIVILASNNSKTINKTDQQEINEHVQTKWVQDSFV